MAGWRANGSAPSLPPPRPPEQPDLYGKRREFAKVKVLEREIGFLEEELKSMEGLQPASRSCKEVAEFVLCSEDPLIPSCMSSRVEKQRYCDKCTICCSSNPFKSCKCSSCFNTCSLNCCIPKSTSSFSCFSLKSTCCYPKCSELNICPCCNKRSCCCYSCCFCY